jgi:hypothetical protein
MKQKPLTDEDIIIAIYAAYEQRKALRRVKLRVLFNNDIRKRKWYEFWKLKKL